MLDFSTKEFVEQSAFGKLIDKLKPLDEFIRYGYIKVEPCKVGKIFTRSKKVTAAVVNGVCIPASLMRTDFKDLYIAKWFYYKEFNI